MRPMNWAAIIGKITGTVDEHLIHRNNYLLAENRILRSRVKGRMSFSDSERITLAKAAKPFGRTILREIATLVTPDTLLRWHRRLVDNIATPRRADKCSGPGRPPTDAAVVELVLRFARENPSWGYDRIAGALAQLRHTISGTTIGSILKQHGIEPAPDRRKRMPWSEFIAAHKDVLLGCDFFTKEVWTLLGPVTCYVLFFIHVASRKVYVAGMTRNPNEQWMGQIARNITMSDVGFAGGMKYLTLDRDSKHAPSFRHILESAGVECLRLPPQSPNLNAYAERFVRSIKEECLDRLILFGQGSLERAIDQYVEHYHGERPHQGKGNMILFPSNLTTDSVPARPVLNAAEGDGPVSCRQRLGGLLKFYHRAAA